MSGVLTLDLPGIGFAANGATRRNTAAPDLSPPRFVAGEENRLVASAVTRLLAPVDQRQIEWKSVVFVGPVACGKSHLARGIASAWESQGLEGQVLVLSATEFRQRLDEAIRIHKMDVFRARLRSLKLLVIEDLHQLHDARHVREELCATLDALEENESLLLATSSKPPCEIGSLDRTLISRLSGGLTLDIAPLSLSSRAELLRQALEARGCRLDPGAANELSAAISGDIRRLLGTAARLRDRFASIGLINQQLAHAFLSDERRPTSPPLRDIAGAVAKYYGMPVSKMRSSTRKQPIVLARAVAIFLAREFTPLSYDEIGRFFGGRDHTTIMHNHQRIDSALGSDHALRAAVNELRQTIKNP